MSLNDKTYGVQVGQIYVPTDKSSRQSLKVLTVDLERSDAIVLESYSGNRRSIELSKLAAIGYTLKPSDQMSEAKGLTQKTGFYYLGAWGKKGAGENPSNSTKGSRSIAYATKEEALENLDSFKESTKDWAVKINLMRQHPGGPLKLEVLKTFKLNESKEESSKGLQYEDPKSFGRKVFNKFMSIPSGPYKYKIGDVVSYVMQPVQVGGSGTGEITKLLDGHHYLVNGKPVNQNEITKKIQENSDLQSIGKNFKSSKSVPIDEPEEIESTETPETPEPIEQNIKPEHEFVIGDIVKPTKGPHKNELHSIVGIGQNGTFEIIPKDIEPANIRYKSGKGGLAKFDELVLAESVKLLGLFTKGSLLVQLQNHINEDKMIKDQEEWQAAVRKKYPNKAIKFKGRVEGGKSTVSAEVSGEDRCYGVWDDDKEEGEVLGEGWKNTVGAVALAAAVGTGIALSPKVEIDGVVYDRAISSAPSNAKSASVMLNGKKTKVKYWAATGSKFNRQSNVYSTE